MESQFPLAQIDASPDKTPEQWFEEYAARLEETGYESIPLLNRDAVQRLQLVRFRGLISNQLNNEYFAPSCQFRDADDVSQSADDAEPSRPADIRQRFPMVLRSEPNQCEWAKSVVFGAEPEHCATDVLAKFYCNAKKLKIADSNEVFGVWSPPKPAESAPVADAEQKQEAVCPTAVPIPTELYIPPTNSYAQLPTLHVLFWRKLPMANPLMPCADMEFYREKSSVIRASLLSLIARRFVSGDRLLAEFLLLHLISRTVSSSSQSEILMGHFALNVRGHFDAHKIRELYRELMPFTLVVPLRIASLNAKRLDPVKNNATDELEIGALQFREHTAVVIDETMLGQGQLNETGLRNLESLKVLLREQRVNYDFEFHTIPFDVRSTDLVLSRSKPLPQLETFCHIYAEVLDDEEEMDDEDNEEEEFTLEQYRVYLSLCSALVNKFELNSEEVTKAIADDFVEIRQKDDTATQETLHHRLLLMRLINSSFLDLTNDDDMMNILKYMQMLENKRSARNHKHKPAVSGKNGKTAVLNSIEE